jgi:hypothetical protein
MPAAQRTQSAAREALQRRARHRPADRCSGLLGGVHADMPQADVRQTRCSCITDALARPVRPTAALRCRRSFPRETQRRLSAAPPLA